MIEALICYSSVSRKFATPKSQEYNNSPVTVLKVSGASVRLQHQVSSTPTSTSLVASLMGCSRVVSR